MFPSCLFSIWRRFSHAQCAGFGSASTDSRPTNALLKTVLFDYISAIRVVNARLSSAVTRHWLTDLEHLCNDDDDEVPTEDWIERRWAFSRTAAEFPGLEERRWPIAASSDHCADLTLPRPETWHHKRIICDDYHIISYQKVKITAT